MSDEAQARLWLATAPRCTVCHQPVATYGRTVHYLCDPTAIEGKLCTCPPDCTDTHWGIGPQLCDPACVPCRLMYGQPHR